MLNILSALCIITGLLPGFITTPKGNVVLAYHRTEMSSDEYDECLSIDTLFTSDIRIAVPTTKYNCHSYAWYSQNINTNTYWVQDPSKFYTDGSYIEVSYSQVQPRDRIVYLDSVGKNIHSGIVKGTTGLSPNGVCGYSNTVWVQSKWGQCGLYEHRGDQCPYTMSTYGGTAVSVKFYRYNISHTHNYSYNTLDSKYHYVSCDCGDLIIEHTFGQQQIFPMDLGNNNPNYIPRYECIYCGYTSSTGGIL